MQEMDWFLSEIDKSCKRSKSVLMQLSNILPESFDGEEPEDAAECGILFSDLTGLTSELFPRYLSLSQEHLAVLVAALAKLYHRYGLNPVFQSRASNRVKYLQMRDFCPQMVFPNPGSMVDVEFCDYHSGRCPYAEECHLAHLLVNNCYIFRVKSLEDLN